MAKLLISISGPTGIGKTAWGIRIGKLFETEILSADSRQFYRELRIGVARPSPEELAAIPHHFIAHRSIEQPYSVGDFREDAISLLKILFKKHHILLLVGGSGLYMDAVTQGLDEFPKIASGVREAVQALYATEGLPALQLRLKKMDPDYYEEVDQQNPRRLMRALEVSLSSGKPFSRFLGSRKPPDFFRHLPLGITAPREIVYERIEKRIDTMMAEGLLEEAQALYPHRRLSALQTVGYQELFAYMEGKWDLDTAVEQIKKNTRRFAKRQGTWLKRNPDIHWIAYDEDPEVVCRRVQTLANKNDR
jgi:tRNA dimethylallyltransferase